MRASLLVPTVLSPRRSLASLFARYGGKGVLFHEFDPARRHNGLPLSWVGYDGVTAVDAINDPLGAMLDESRRAALSLTFEEPWLYADEAAVLAAGYTAGGVTFVSVEPGEIVLENVAAFGRLEYALAVEAGATYVMQIPLGWTSGALRIWDGPPFSDTLVSHPNITTPHTAIFRPTVETITLRIQNQGHIGNQATFRPYTIRKIAGNHAYQSTDAARPTLQQTAGGVWYLAFDGTNDHLISNVIPSTTMTIAACFRTAGLSDLIVGSIDAGKRTFLSLNGNGHLGAGVGSQNHSVITSGGPDRRGEDVVGLVQFDGSTVLLEENGIPVYDGAQSGAPSGLPLFFGANNEGVHSNHLNGRLWGAMVIDAKVTQPDRLLIQRELSRGVLSL